MVRFIVAEPKKGTCPASCGAFLLRAPGTRRCHFAPYAVAPLIFDEADFRFSDERAEIVKILNNGNLVPESVSENFGEGHAYRSPERVTKLRLEPANTLQTS